MQIDVLISPEDQARIQKLFHDYPQATQEFVRGLAHELRIRAIEKTPIGEKWVKGSGWQMSGRMKSSWSEIQDVGSALAFYCGVPYASVIEFGRYPGIDHSRSPIRTAYGPDGGIYSTQAIGGVIRPIFAEKGELEGLIKKGFVRLEEVARSVDSK